MAEDQKELRIGAKVDKGDFREVILAFKEVERAANSMADALNRAASGIGGAGGIGAGAAGAATTAVGGVASATGAGPAGRGSSLGREIKGIRTEIRALIEDMNRLKREAQDFRSVVTSVGASTVAARGTTMTVSAAAGTGTYTTTPAGQMSGPATPPTTVSSSGGTPPPPSGAPPATAGGGGRDYPASMQRIGAGISLAGSAISGVASFSQMAMTMPLEMAVRGQSLNKMLGQSILSGRLSDAYYFQQMGGYGGMMQNYDVRGLLGAQMLGRGISGIGSVVGGIGGIAGGIAGMAGGAAIGSVIPGIGTVAGGAIGGILGGMATSSGVGNVIGGATTVGQSVLQYGAGGIPAGQEEFMARVLNLAKEQRPFTTMGLDLYGASIPARLQMQRQIGRQRMPSFADTPSAENALYEGLYGSFAQLGFQAPEEQIGTTMAAARRFGPQAVYGTTRGFRGLSEMSRQMVPYGFDYGHTLSTFGAFTEATRNVPTGINVAQAIQGASGGNVAPYVMEQMMGMMAQDRTTVAGRMSDVGFERRAGMFAGGLPEGANLMDLEQRARGIRSIGGISGQSPFLFGATYERLRDVISDPMVRKMVAEAPLQDIADPNFLRAMGISEKNIPAIQRAKLDPLSVSLTGDIYKQVKSQGGLTKYLQAGGDIQAVARQLVATQGARVGGDIETAVSGLRGLSRDLTAVSKQALPTTAEEAVPETLDVARAAPTAKGQLMTQGRINVQTQQISKILGDLAKQLISASNGLSNLGGTQIGRPTAAAPNAVK